MNVVVGFDVDGTLLTFDRAAGVAACAVALHRTIPGVSLEKLEEEIEHGSQLLVGDFGKEAQHAAEVHNTDVFHALVSCANADERLENAAWSKYSRLAQIAERHGMNPQEISSQLVQAEAAFWLGIGTASRMYPDAEETICQIAELTPHRFFLSNTDARVSMHGPTGMPRYSVADALLRKRLRFGLSRLYRGRAQIRPEEVLVTDPWHKDEPRVWERYVFPRFPAHGDRARWAYIGDSKLDVIAAAKVGIGVRILVDRYNYARLPPEATHVVKELAEIPDIIRSI